MERIKQGSIIRGSYWPEPVEIKLVEEAGDYIRDCCRSGQLAAVKKKQRGAVVMAIEDGGLSVCLGATPSNRAVKALTARFRLMTVAVSQS